MEVSLVCVFSYLKHNLGSVGGPPEQGYTKRITSVVSGPLRFAVPPRQKKVVPIRSPGRAVTVETIEDIAEGGRTPEQTGEITRPSTAHLSQATTVADILNAPVESQEARQA